MLATILLLTLFLLLIQVFSNLKLRARFKDLDRRFEKLESNFIRTYFDLNKLNDTLRQNTLEIQNNICLSTIDFEYPVFFGDWSIDSFLGKFLTQHLLEKRPQVILELGSGSSSLLIAKSAQKIGYKPEHIVIDHEERYLELTRLLAKQNGLDDRIEFNFCPLGNIDSKNLQWYQDVPLIIENRKIDLLIIDGPPGTTNPMARYPALPILNKYLSENCVVILDDANRNDEKAIIKEWLELYNFELTLLPDGHGLAIMTRLNN